MEYRSKMLIMPQNLQGIRNFGLLNQAIGRIEGGKVRNKIKTSGNVRVKIWAS